MSELYTVETIAEVSVNVTVWAESQEEAERIVEEGIRQRDIGRDARYLAEIEDKTLDIIRINQPSPLTV